MANKVRTTNVLVPVEVDGGETYDAMQCPVCQYGYVQLVSIKRVGYDHSRSFNGLATVTEGSTVLAFACEAGHNFELIFAEHGGGIFTSAMRKADTGDVLFARDPESLTTTIQAVGLPPISPIENPVSQSAQEKPTVTVTPNGSSAGATAPTVRAPIATSANGAKKSDSVHGNM